MSESQTRAGNQKFFSKFENLKKYLNWANVISKWYKFEENDIL